VINANTCSPSKTKIHVRKYENQGSSKNTDCGIMPEDQTPVDWCDSSVFVTSWMLTTMTKKHEELEITCYCYSWSAALCFNVTLTLTSNCGDRKCRRWERALNSYLLGGLESCLCWNLVEKMVPGGGRRCHSKKHIFCRHGIHPEEDSFFLIAQRILYWICSNRNNME